MKNLEGYLKATVDEINKALSNAVYMTEIKAEKYGVKFPGECSDDLFYSYGDNLGWTTGFCTGIMWLAYERTRSEKLKDIALLQVKSFLERIEKRIDVDHHDMGFLYSLSCIAAYQLTGNEEGKKAAILAADNLISRFNKTGQFIQAWGEMGKAENYRLIIDCMLNVPLLFKVSQITGDDKYADIAKKHIKTSLSCILKEDNSTYHTYYFDNRTGEPLYGKTAQGNRDGSAWSRGQAWGIYGCALAYRYTKDIKCLENFRKIAEFFIDGLPENLVPFWDFDFSDGSGEPRDSSAGAIAVCGLMEMASLLDNEEGKRYKDIALKMLKALIDNCAVTDLSVSDGLLLHSTYCRGTATNERRDTGVDECSSWGDYFYMEALTRAITDWKLYW